MKVKVADNAGACFGVLRALTMAKDASKKADSMNVSTIGPLIHNPLVVESLAQDGVVAIDNTDEIKDGLVILRSHGVTPELEDSLKAKGLEILDATCPFVKHVQMAAKKLVEENYQVILVGERGHAEVQGIEAYAKHQAFVVESLDELKNIKLKKRVGIVVQTTQSTELLQQVISYLLPKTKELRVFNTICAATSDRQKAAYDLAQEVDVMIVIGGKNSGNTRRLASISKQVCNNVYHIEDIDDIDPSWFSHVELVGITAGASTPHTQIETVVNYLEGLAT